MKRDLRWDTYQPDPLNGLFEATISVKSAMVEYEPDTDLRDTEQLQLSEDGGIEAFLRREVLPHAPDAWYVPDSVKVGYEILQAATYALPGRDSCRHPGAGKGDQGSTG